MKASDRHMAVLWFLFILAGALPAAAGAMEVNLVSETILRGFERDTVEQDDATILPAYEYLRADVGALQEKGLSFHLNGWGRVDLGDGGFYEDDSAGELLYGYFQYLQPTNSLDLRLGRLYLFEGVANESVDGLRLGSDLTPYFAFSAYGGFPVGLDSTDGRSGDSIWGGRFAHHLRGLYEVGVSYKQTENDRETADEMLGIDLSAALPLGMSLYGFSKRNLETEGWAEHSYDLSIVFGDLQLRPYYRKFRYEDYFGIGAKAVNPFPFLQGTGETLEILGSDLTWALANGIELGVRAKTFDYREQGDASDFISCLLNWRGEGLTGAGAEFGSMQGEAAENDYLLGRAYFYWDGLLPHGFVSGDVVYVDYDEEIFGETDAFFASLGGGRRFLDDALEFRLSGDYSSDPFFDSDLRGMLTARYTFDR